MTLHPFLVFVHVLGAGAIFAAIGIEAAALGGLRRAATPADARVWLGVLELPLRIGAPAMIATVASGVWMTVTVWGHPPWIAATFAAIVAMAAAGGAVTGRRMRRVREALVTEGGEELSAPFRSLLSARALTASLRIRIALTAGIVGLMTAKPDAAGSAMILAAAAAAGVIAGAARPIARRAQIEASEA